jgi:hypothetical protein
MRRHRQRPRPRTEWEALVREWRAGDLTQREFATRKGVAPTTLSWWSCKVGGKRQGKAPAFVPVRLVGGAAGGGDFRLEVCGGRTLHVPMSFDEGALRRLLEVLEGAAC